MDVRLNLARLLAALTLALLFLAPLVTVREGWSLTDLLFVGVENLRLGALVVACLMIATERLVSTTWKPASLALAAAAINLALFPVLLLGPGIAAIVVLVALVVLSTRRRAAWIVAAAALSATALGIRPDRVLEGMDGLVAGLLFFLPMAAFALLTYAVLAGAALLCLPNLFAGRPKTASGAPVGRLPWGVVAAAIAALVATVAPFAPVLSHAEPDAGHVTALPGGTATVSLDGIVRQEVSLSATCGSVLRRGAHTSVTYTAPHANGEVCLVTAEHVSGWASSRQVLVAAVPGDAAVVGAASAGFGASVVVDAAGRLWSWGHEVELLGRGVGASSLRVAAPPDVQFVSVAEAGNSFVALDAHGRPWAWGNGDGGQLGRTDNRRLLPTAIERMPAKLAKVSGGSSFYLALDTSGDLWVWGQTGAFGDRPQARPTRVSAPAGRTFVDVAAGDGHAVALDADGGAWTWGRNGWGQLGDGTAREHSATAARVWLPADVRLTAVAAGPFHSIGRDTSGQLWVWGADQTRTDRQPPFSHHHIPLRVSAPSERTFVRFGGGFTYSLALDDRGCLWGWPGSGPPQPTPTARPFAMPRGVRFADLTVGTYSAVAIDTDGRGWTSTGDTLQALVDGGSERQWLSIHGEGDRLLQDDAVDAGETPCSPE
jgi:hypothetical protein